jgi:hypothetical protein
MAATEHPARTMIQGTDIAPILTQITEFVEAAVSPI